MRKKLIALIMSTVMLCGIQIVPAFALDPSNAAVRYDSVNGNVEYLDSLPTAFSSGTYTLLKDVTRKSRMVMNADTREVTLDLNGHTLTSTADDYGILLERNGTASNPKVFTLTSSNGIGKLKVNTSTDSALQVQGRYVNATIDKDVVVEDGNVTVASECQRIDVYGTIKTGNYYAVTTNKSISKDAIISIHDSAVIESKNVAVYLSGQGTVEVKGGTITGKTAICQRKGSLVVSGGEMFANGPKRDYSYTANGIEPTGDALVLDNTEMPLIAVTGGRFTSKNGAAAASYGIHPVGKLKFIKGGTFLGKEKINLELIYEDMLYAEGTNNDVYVEDFGAADYAESYPEKVVPLPEGKTLYYNGLPQAGIKGGQMVFYGDNITGTSDGAFATDPGTYKATAKLNKNYVWADKTFSNKEASFTIKNGIIKATVKDYKGKYDGKTHNITISGVEPKDAVIEYSLDGKTYTKTAPAIKDVGEHTVYYRLSKKPYYDVKKGSAKVEITGRTPAQSEADKVAEMIEALPTDILLKDESAVVSARSAYSRLSSDQKTLIPDSTYNRLVNAEKKIKDLKDSATAKRAETALKALPRDITLATKSQIKEARAAYDALTKAQKGKVDSTLVKRLHAAEFYQNKLTASRKTVSLKSVKAKKGAARLSWTTNDEVNGYQIKFSRYKSFKKSGKVTVSDADELQKTVTKLRSGKKYYFKVRPYTSVYDGQSDSVKKVYGSYSNVKSCKVK